MKRNGFTLAEILITLGIVGVVAALTAPALVKNTAGAKVGPTLAKEVNTIEVANEQLMLDKNISDLQRVYGNNIGTYFADLSKYIRKSAYNSTKNITIYDYDATHNPRSTWRRYTGEFLLPEGASIYPGEMYDHAESRLPQNDPCYNSATGNYMDWYIDINGSQSGNNMLGDDVFRFILSRNGVMIPWGSQVYVNEFKRGNNGFHWTIECNAQSVRDASACAGSIFENNLKIIYQ